MPFYNLKENENNTNKITLKGILLPAIVLTNVNSVYVVGNSVNPLQYDGHHDDVFNLLTILVPNYE